MADPAPRSSFSLRKRFLFVLLATAGGLLLLEGVARLVPFRDWIARTAVRSPTIDLNLAAGLATQGRGFVRYNRPDAVLLWRNDPRAGLYAFLNSLGYRGPEFRQEKAPGALRVAFLGDSVAFGFGIEDTATIYPTLVESSLRAAGRAAEVLNFAVPGYSSYQGRRQLETETLRFHPDVVCAAFGWNDHWEAYRYPDKDQTRLALLLAGGSGFLDKSALAGLVQVGVVYARYFFRTSAIVPDPKERADKPAISATRAGLILRVSPDDYRANLAAIARLARERGAIPILGTAPHLPGEVVCMFRVCFEPEIHESYNQIVRALCAETGIALADVDRTFRESAASSAEPLFLDNGIHFSPAGHRLAARVWTEAIEKGLNEHR